ncbi:MAG: rod shape-determining protein RodA [Armatimonadetes bacterium]|nr:rod shape-determining protein RodA [Armatimonadota bacterium]
MTATNLPPGGMTVQRGKRDLFRISDPFLLLSAAILIAFGLALIFSEGFSRGDLSSFRKQMVFFAIGLIPFGLFLRIHPRSWIHLSSYLYGLNLLMLSAVLVVGRRSHNAQRWIEFHGFEFQPSEMAKLLIILTLAAFFLNRRDQIHKFSTFALSFLHVLVPLVLIMKQPSLGASLVLLATWLSICLVAQVPLKFVLGSGGAIVLMLVMAIQFQWLKPYQLERVEGLMHGNSQSNKYQALRAEIAFGSGGLGGTGYLKGEQKRGGYIPEQNTDFIFTVMGEEGGLVGCTLVLAAFGFLFYRIWLVVVGTQDLYYRMIAAGILGLLAFHTFVNLGMVLQLLPVVGQWLPFLSYGGTALWLCMACIGLLLSVRSQEIPKMY